RRNRSRNSSPSRRTRSRARNRHKIPFLWLALDEVVIFERLSKPLSSDTRHVLAFLNDVMPFPPGGLADAGRLDFVLYFVREIFHSVGQVLARLTSRLRGKEST